MERTVLPHLFDIADATIRMHERKVEDKKTSEMVDRAKELCGGKPVPVPFNAETRVLTLEVCSSFFHIAFFFSRCCCIINSFSCLHCFNRVERFLI